MDQVNEIKNKISEDNSEEFVLSEFEQYLNNLPTLFECANSHAEYKRIVLDVEIDSNLLNSLISFLPKNKTFTEISFSAKITADFESFSNAENLNQIKQLIFQKFKLEPKLIDTIVKIINNTSLDLLQFNACLDDNVLDQLISKLSNLEKFKKIPILDFSQTSSSITKYLNAFKNAKKLILQNCDIEILPFLQSLFELGSTELESIDLTGNSCTEGSGNQIRFPTFLNEIILDDVQFEFTQFDELFTSLMKFFAKENSSYQVSLSNVSLKDSEWGYFLSQITNKTVHNLARLNWSNNNVNKQFSRFVNSIKSLLSLNISGCIDNTPETTEIIPVLLRQNYTIKELIIDSGDTNELDDDSAEALIKDIPNNYSLKSLSLYDQPLSDENAIKLANALVENRRIKKLVYNFSGIEQKETLVQFFKVLSKRGRPLFIKYPIDALENFSSEIGDFEQAKQSGIENYKSGFIGQLNAEFSKVVSGDRSIVVPPESVAFADINGNIAVGDDNVDDDLSGLNYDPIRKQPWTNNVASKMGATEEQLREASTSTGESGIQYQYVSLSDLPKQPSQVKPNNQPTQQPGSLFDLDDDEILQIVNNHRKDPSKIAQNRLPITPQEYQQYRQGAGNMPNNGGLPDLPALGDLNGLPPLGNLNGMPPLGDLNGMPPPPNQGMDLPPLADLPDIPGVNAPMPPPVNVSGLPPPPQGMTLPPPPPQGMSLPPPPKGMDLPQIDFYKSHHGERPAQIATMDVKE